MGKTINYTLAVFANISSSNHSDTVTPPYPYPSTTVKPFYPPPYVTPKCPTGPKIVGVEVIVEVTITESCKTIDSTSTGMSTYNLK